jgi:phosphoglycolate phosphatase-like HAD superfamily hydrolase
MLRATIWDVDGTLVDTAEQHFRARVDVWREKGRDFTRADFAPTFGRRNPEILAYQFGDPLGKGEAEACADRKEELYREAARHGVEFLPGVVEEDDERLARQRLSRPAVDEILGRLVEADADEARRGCYLAVGAQQADGLLDLLRRQRFEGVAHGSLLGLGRGVGFSISGRGGGGKGNGDGLRCRVHRAPLRLGTGDRNVQEKSSENSVDKAIQRV